jgi:Uma2 family endonuclease
MALLKDHQETLMTGEELFRRPDLGPCELVNGRVVPLSPTGAEHADVELELGTRLRLYGKETGWGRAIGGEVGIYIRRHPDTVRAADIAFISKERDIQSTKGYFEVAPELVVEVLSPNDSWSEVTEKLTDYFSAGVDCVWIVDPKLRCVFAYRSLTEVRQFREGEDLVDEELLPGFHVAVKDLFLYDNPL